MSDSFNRVTLIGNLGDDPRIIDLSEGKRLASLNVATSRSWVDKGTGERKNQTEWHRVIIYNENLIAMIERRGAKKGSKLFIEGMLTNRKWIDKNGQNRVTTEVVLNNFGASLIVIQNRGEDSAEDASSSGQYKKQYNNNNGYGDSARANEYQSETTADEYDEFINNDFNLDPHGDKLPY